MKKSVPAPKTAVKTPVSKIEMLHKKVVAAEKSVQRALADCEKKSAAYADALKQQSDKITLLSLMSAAKIAKLTYKIKRTQYKLAKVNWKTTVKAEKKAADKISKAAAAIKPESKKSGKKAPKDAAAAAKSGKKKAAARA